MKNNKGLTIVELLATIFILGIVTILVFSFINNTNAEGKKQTKENHELQTITYALKIMTKDVRQSTGATVIDPNQFIFESALGASNNVTYQYDVTNKILSRNALPIALNIEHFEATHSPAFLTLKMINSQNEEITTTLYYRKE